jgi:hypothetical protein
MKLFLSFKLIFRKLSDIKREQELGDINDNTNNNNNNNNIGSLGLFRKFSTDRRTENEYINNESNNKNKNQSLCLSFNSDKLELLKQLSKNTANIQINEKVNKKIKNTKKSIIHLAKNPKDKWLLIMCRAKGGIENIPKIFLANLDANSLFTVTDSSAGDLSIRNESTEITFINNNSKKRNSSIRSEFNILSLDSNNNNNNINLKQSNLNFHPNNRVVNALFEIRFELKKDIDNINNKMGKIDEKILALIQTLNTSVPDSRDPFSPLSEKSNIEFIDSFSATSPTKNMNLLKPPSPRFDDINSNILNSSIITTFNEVIKVPKSPTTIIDTNKINTIKFNKSKSLATDLSSGSGISKQE